MCYNKQFSWIDFNFTLFKSCRPFSGLCERNFLHSKILIDLTWLTGAHPCDGESRRAARPRQSADEPSTRRCHDILLGAVGADAHTESVRNSCFYLFILSVAATLSFFYILDKCGGHLNFFNISQSVAAILNLIVFGIVWPPSWIFCISPSVAAILNFFVFYFVNCGGHFEFSRFHV